MLTEEKLLEVIMQRRMLDDSYLRDALNTADADNTNKRWELVRALWEERGQYDLPELDEKLGEIAAGNYEFYEKASAHFWTNHLRAKVQRTDGKWRKPAKRLMRMRTD